MNATVNGSTCSSLFNPAAAKIGTTIAYCLLFVVSLVGNSFIALIVYKTQNMRKPVNYFITNMAMSDLLYPIFVFSFNLTMMYVDSWLISGPLGQALCKIVFFVVHVSYAVSIQSLILIAVDRFGAVVFPLRSPLISSRRCLFFILATWIVAMAVNSPILFAYKLVEYPELPLACKSRWNEAFGESSSEANYFLAMCIVFLYLPIALLSILYSIVVIKLKTQKIPGEQSVNAVEQRARRNRNVLKLAIAIVLAFVLCLVPWSIINILDFFAPDRLPHCDLFLYGNIAHFMLVSNCAINPCICFVFSGKYRQGLKNLLKCFA